MVQRIYNIKEGKALKIKVEFLEEAVYKLILVNIKISIHITHKMCPKKECTRF